MKKILILLFTLVLAGTAAESLADLAQPQSRSIENTIDYEAPGIQIHIDQWLYDFRKTDLRFYVADIVLENPGQLQTAFAGDEYSKKNAEATSAIAERHNAVFAVNGDYYNYRDNYGLVIRNGVLYRDKRSNCDQLLIYSDGSFKVVFKGEYEEGHGQEYLDAGVVQSFSFGPVLVNDGEIVELPKKYIINTADTIREPRTGIGMVEPGHYVFIVADGRRKNWSDKGMALQEMQIVFKEMGCQVAYNLDGGGSATMVLNGELVNRSSGSRERNVSDIIYLTAQ